MSALTSLVVGGVLGYILYEVISDKAPPELVKITDKIASAIDCKIFLSNEAQCACVGAKVAYNAGRELK